LSSSDKGKKIDSNLNSNNLKSSTMGEDNSMIMAPPLANVPVQGTGVSNSDNSMVLVQTSAQVKNSLTPNSNISTMMALEALVPAYQEVGTSKMEDNQHVGGKGRTGSQKLNYLVPNSNNSMITVPMPVLRSGTLRDGTTQGMGLALVSAPEQGMDGNGNGQVAVAPSNKSIKPLW
jgi:hypothetical protein